MDAPDLHLNIDRSRAAEFGLTAQDVANSLFVLVVFQLQVQPNFWLDPKMGMTYLVAAQTPQYRLDSVAKVENTPISVRRKAPAVAQRSGDGQHSVHPVNANHAMFNPCSMSMPTFRTAISAR